MRIQIEITKKMAEHLRSPHTFYDGCGPGDDCLKLVQKQIDKKFKELKK